MKNILFLILTLIISMIFSLGLRSTNPTSPIQSSSSKYNRITDITPLESVRMMIGEVNEDRLLTDLRKLAGEEQICLAYGCYTLTNRLTGSSGVTEIGLAKDFIEQELTDLGYSVERHDWTNSGLSDQHLIVRKRGFVNPEEEIYFVAHLDVASSARLAADDNASGVVSLLELARILSHRVLNTTVVLMFSTGEEQETRGVQSYLNQLTSEEIEAIRYVINCDMLGYDANNDKVMELWNGNQPVEDLVQPMFDVISAYDIDLAPQIESGCN